MADEDQTNDMPNPEDASPEEGASPSDGGESEAQESAEPSEEPTGEAPEEAVPEAAEEETEALDPDAEALLAAAQAAVSEMNDDASGAASGGADEAAIEAAMMEAMSGGGDAPAAPPDGAQPVNLPDFGGATGSDDPQNLEMLSDVDLDVKIELGRTSMLIDDVLRLNEGAVVELDKLAGDPVDVFVNDRIVARGEVLVLNDNFCVRINEVLDRAAMEAAQRGGRVAG